jgi:3'-phosphoadenosine 5'-phosphosulfate sulfotransferase (PAPS reductase)/FAD synthetase/formate hydrogenlyase subunit 6/NADH:ubiquinone oxidoreductase subunit I
MFKINWDKENNGVLLTMKSNDEALNVPPRPVFFEELDLLGLDKFWKYPKSKEPLLWACNRRYFYRGELVLEAKGGNIYDDPQLIFTDAGKKLKLEPVNIDLLCKKNETTMFLLEHEALEFINTIYRRYRPNAAQKTVNEVVDFQVLAEMQEKKTKEKYTVVKEDCDSFDIIPLTEAEKVGKQIVLNTKTEIFIASFSGGKDSQVVLDLVSRVIPSNDFSVIYSDTGYEIPPSLEIYEQTKKLYQKQYPDLQFYLSKNHQDVLYYWDKMGSPSNIQRWCCSVMKTAPLYKELKRISGKGKQPHVLTFDGIRGEESSKRANYSRIGKDVKHNNVINASPIFHWNLIEIYLYLFGRHLPINPAYRCGLTRVGCVTCPFASSWNDNICLKQYPEKLKPFDDKIKEIVRKSGIKDVENYIKEGNWKIRAGGRTIDSKSSLNIISTTPDFKAVLTNSQENIFAWLKVLGKVNYTEQDGIIKGEIKYKKSIFQFELTNSDKNNIIVEFKNVGYEILFVSHLKKVLNKAAYCVHCEVCEVECPTGALSVVPMVTVNENKCIHCFKCLDFDEKGCIIANSIKISGGKNMDKKASLNRYNNFGFRENWLAKYFDKIDAFFNDDKHGLNVQNQIPSLVNWLRDAEILKQNDKTVTELGKKLSQNYYESQNKIWEIIWINLTEKSEICGWFATNVEFSRAFQKAELEILLKDTYPDYSPTTLSNALGALLNTFKESPLGKAVSVGVLTQVDKKPALIRQPYNDLSPVAVAYSLYRYAESKKRYALTVSEFYDNKQTEGIYRQFGILRERVETVLRTLKEDKNRVLNADLNMGLDNINLREDLTAMDILQMLL